MTPLPFKLVGAAWLLSLLVASRPVSAQPAAAPHAALWSYVPPPQPADTGRYLVGAVMCPLWQSGQRWGQIEPFAAREPLLGWYDEGNPEVTDWEIKWSLDHGISFFLVCWYRQPGNVDEPAVRPGLEHWIRDGLFHSRYGSQFKFAIMWENANKEYSGQTSRADFLTKLVPFWIANYFTRPNYLSLDGKPVFSIFDPGKFVQALGGEAQAAEAIAGMRDACRKAGFKGIHILGQNCWGKPQELREKTAQCARLSLDENWGYHWPTFTGAFGQNLHPSGEEALAAQERLWAGQPQNTILNLSVGWDEAPWKFRYSKAQWRLTPAEFQQLCADAKKVLDQRAGEGVENRLVLLDNWNEFGEGHYIEPTRQDGFAYLNAVRAVFAPNAPPVSDLSPRDIGRGPYDSAFRDWKRRNPGEPGDF